MNCTFERLENQRIRCTDCGYDRAWARDDFPTHACKTRNVDGPGIVRKAFNFAVALAKHAADGFQRRTKEEIEAILETHCQPCPFFSGTICTHKKCGCGVNREQKFFNKLALRSESCPDGRWT